MDQELKIYKQLTPNIYCGNVPDGIVHANIIINLGASLRDGSGKPYSKCMQISVPNVELLDSELKKVITKLNEYSAFITSAGNVNIYIHSVDNIQGLLLMVGYHMVKIGAWNVENVIEKLDTLLFTDDDHSWERLNMADMSRALEAGDLPKYATYVKEAPRRIFTSNSFKKILMSVK